MARQKNKPPQSSAISPHNLRSWRSWPVSQSFSEKLDFQKKRAELESVDRRAARMLSSFAFNKTRRQHQVGLFSRQD